MSTLRRILIASALATIAITAALYTGYVKTYFGHEDQTTFFIKRYPTLQMAFYDPFSNEGDDKPIDQLPPADRVRFADYCKYRFGIADDGAAALAGCKTMAVNALRAAGP